MALAADLLAVAAQRDLAQLDEKLYFDVFTKTPPPTTTSTSRGRRRANR